MSRSFISVTVSMLAALSLAGCAQDGVFPQIGLDLAGTSNDKPAQSDAAKSKPDKAKLAKAYETNPKDAAAARAYVVALRASGESEEALTVAGKALKASPKDAELRRLHAMLSLEQGKVAYAEKTLARDKSSDWRSHSALGVAYASRGRQKEAQAEFDKALKLSPDQPSVLNNLALSYALEGKREKAEAILRKLAKSKDADPRVRQNLALVVGVGGRIEESVQISRSVMPKAAVQSNAQYLSELTQGGGDKRADAAAAQSNIRLTRRVGEDPTKSSTRTASASLPKPTYQLGGPVPAR